LNAAARPRLRPGRHDRHAVDHDEEAGEKFQFRGLV
jgi:hypothetical protein